MFFRTAFANDTVIDDSLIDGFYVGVGAQYTHYSNKIKATEGIAVLGDSIQVNTDISHQQIDKFGGTVVAGYGKTFDKFYVGGEALLDINNDCKTDNTYACEGDSLPYSSNIKGIIPSIAVRFGYKCSITYCPIYAKFGISWLRSEFQEKSELVVNNIRKMSKITPTIGLGFEKKICNSFNLRGELDYRIQIKGTSQTFSKEAACQYNVENRLKGLTCRIMMIHKF